MLLIFALPTNKKKRKSVRKQKHITRKFKDSMELAFFRFLFIIIL